jgi:hypothetical protein
LKKKRSGEGGPRPPPKVKAPTIRTAFEMFFKAVYACPALAGWGEHWYLTDMEAAALGEQAEASLSALPSKKAEAISRIVASYAPLVGLIGTAWVITQARVVETRRMRATAHETGAAGDEVAGGIAPSGAAGDGKGGPPKAARRDRTNLFRQAE